MMAIAANTNARAQLARGQHRAVCIRRAAVPARRQVLSKIRPVVLLQGAKVGPGTIVLLFSVLLTAYSAFLSFGYFQKVKVSGQSVLGGWKQMQNFFNHVTLNFVGAVAAIVSLQASIGTQVMQTLTSSASSLITHKAGMGADVGLQFLAQAASNTLLAHIVSILFLTLLLKKTTDSYEPIIELADKLRA